MLLCLLALACESTPQPPASPPAPSAEEDTAALTGASDTEQTDPEGGAAGGAEDPPSYTGPSYGACVTDAECAPGDACTTVPGYAGLYCAPPCDPAGDGAECQLEGLDFATACTAYGRCAQACPEDAGTSCPEGLDCQDVDGEQLCAGEVAGGAGYYGTCSHPQAEGSDCPVDSTCFGGELLGVDDGICMPWCEDYTCPDPPAGVDAYPYCYDIGLGYPTCALLCDPDSGSCPAGQECYDVDFIGICVPEGTSVDFEDLY